MLENIILENRVRVKGVQVRRCMTGPSIIVKTHPIITIDKTCIYYYSNVTSVI